jgi:exodeoxyribonuclease VII small subunit
MAKKEAEKSKSYRHMSDELAELMAWFESRDVDIDEAVNKYEQAMELIGQMEEYLKTAENKIRKVSLK